MLEEKRCMCCVGLDEAFDRVLRKVLDWAIQTSILLFFSP